jgi:hypothetical protein
MTQKMKKSIEVLTDVDDEYSDEPRSEPNGGPMVTKDEPDGFERLINERKDSDHRTALSLHFRELAIQMNSKRNVQTGTLGLSTTYIDTDKTGGYDPRAERRKVAPKRKPRTSGERDANGGKSKVLSSKRVVGRIISESTSPESSEDSDDNTRIKRSKRYKKRLRTNSTHEIEDFDV